MTHTAEHHATPANVSGRIHTGINATTALEDWQTPAHVLAEEAQQAYYRDGLLWGFVLGMGLTTLAGMLLYIVMR